MRSASCSQIPAEPRDGGSGWALGLLKIARSSERRRASGIGFDPFLTEVFHHLGV